MPTKNLTPEERERVRAHCQQGYQTLQISGAKDAIRLFYQAWLALPKPQYEYEEAGWVLIGLGDSYYHNEQYDLAQSSLQSALHCPMTDNIALLQLRLGQAHYKQNHLPEARQHLWRAWQLEGSDLFSNIDPCFQRAIADLISTETS